MSNDESRSGESIWSPKDGALDVLTVVQFSNESGDHIDVFSGENVPVPDVGDVISIGRINVSEQSQGNKDYQVLNQKSAYYKVKLGHEDNADETNGNDDDNGDETSTLLQLVHIRTIVREVSE